MVDWPCHRCTSRYCPSPSVLNTLLSLSSFPLALTCRPLRDFSSFMDLEARCRAVCTSYITRFWKRVQVGQWYCQDVGMFLAMYVERLVVLEQAKFKVIA